MVDHKAELASGFRWFMALLTFTTDAWRFLVSLGVDQHSRSGFPRLHILNHPPVNQARWGLPVLAGLGKHYYALAAL